MGKGRIGTASLEEVIVGVAHTRGVGFAGKGDGVFIHLIGTC